MKEPTSAPHVVCVCWFGQDQICPNQDTYDAFATSLRGSSHFASSMFSYIIAIQPAYCHSMRARETFLSL